MQTPGEWSCLDLRRLDAYLLLSSLSITGKAGWWCADGQLGVCAEPAWGWAVRQLAKTNTLCWNLDSPYWPHSVFECCCGCLDCSLDLEQCHVSCQRSWHLSTLFPANKSSQTLEHHGVQCQDTAPPQKVTGSSPALSVQEQANILCTMLLKKMVFSWKVKYWLSVRRAPLCWVLSI